MTQHSNSEIRKPVRSYILNEFLPGTEPGELEDDTPLLSSGILDSISTVKLMAFLENEYAIQVQPHEMSADYLDSVSDIVSLVESKQCT